MAHLQLSSYRQLLTHRLQSKSNGHLNNERNELNKTEIQCHTMEEFEELASAIWHGKLVFEVGDIVEARFQVS